MTMLLEVTPSFAEEGDDVVRVLDSIGAGWQPDRTENYAADCKHGAALAREIVLRMQDDENPTLLGVVAQRIVEAGRWDAVEIGFFSRLAAGVM